MKRFFQRLDNSSNYQRDYQRQEGPSSYSSSGSFLGKVFTVGQYHCTVEDVIAEGGFSLVFLVKANNGIRYALKRLYVNNEQDLFICKREIEIARKLGSHKNIVKLVESSINYCGNDVHEIFMLMQYCKGQLLHLMNDKINTGFSEREIIRIICDLCEAIARMHHNDPPIIHRDLKIENILISDDGNYMLCDFGSATSKTISLDSGQSALSIEEEIKRYTTLAYRSPEMVDVYSGKLITTKADIWALGCLLYKLCYYNLPFGESTLAIQNAQLTIPDSYADRYSQRLSSLIAYMLVPNPDDRPDIYQISSLMFSFTGNECPVLNRNNVKTPSWSDLRPPPTESQAREIKRTIPPTISNDRTLNSNTATTNILSNLYQQNNHLDTDKTTTSVTPRQRPKATININSVLTTSPVTFQRSHTPSNIDSESNLTIKDAHHNIGLTNSHSFSSGSQLFSKVESINKNNNRNNETDWSKADKQSPTFASNPILNNDNGNNNNSTSDHDDFITSKTSSSSLNNNPFITSRNNNISGKEMDLNGKNTSVPTPPPRNQSLTLLENASSSATTYQHRRNMSDSFSIKCTDKISQNVNNKSSNIGILRMKSNDQTVSNEFSHNDNSVIRSLNPFEDSSDYSYEDQLFGKEFDKIRKENQQVIDNNNDYNPFEDAPFNHERLKCYLENKQKSSDQKIVITTSDNDSNESIVVKNDNNTDSGGRIVSGLVGASSTSLSERIDSEHHLTSSKTANKSISSSSQGGIATSPTANYMPLYSSDTAEDDDFDDNHQSKRQPRARQINNHIDIEDNVVVAVGVTSRIVDNNDNLRISHHNPHPRFNDISMTGDMTKPLVEDDDDDDDDDLDDHNSDVDDVPENDEHLSIGSASDLQNTDTDDEDDSQDDNDSSSDSLEPNDNNNDYSDNNEDDDDSENDVISFKYGRVKNQSSPLLEKNINKPLLNISRIQVRLNNENTNNNNKMDTININNNDDTTSVSNSSIKSDSQKNIDSLDHLIGHVEGHRPLLEDEEEDDITTTVPAAVLTSSKSLISIEPEQTILIFDDNKNDKSKFYQTKSDKFPRNSYSSGNIHSDFEVTTINQQQIYETEENKRLDEEVERSLIPQVIYDQMNNKDLFGSIPFTNKELINHTIQLQNETVSGQEISNSVTDTENRFENSFTDLPVPIIQESTTSPKEKKEQMKATDLFGAVPFSSSSHSHIATNDSKGQNLVKIPQPLSSSASKLQGAKTGVIKIKVTSTPSSSSINVPVTISLSITSASIINSTTTLTSGVMSGIASTSVAATTSLAKHQPQALKYVKSPNLTSTTTILTTANISTTTSTLSSTAANAGISKLSRNQLQRSNLKIKSKVAKKYEVDESDDEVDGLLDPLENDDIDNDVVQFDSSNKKKNKKDKKEKPDKKSKETKIKEKKEDKKLKNKEKADKVDKNKTKDQIKEEKKREKENKKKEKDKKEKELKDKKKDRKSSETSNIGQSESQPIVCNDNDRLETGNRSIIKDGKSKKGSSNSEIYGGTSAGTAGGTISGSSSSSSSTKKISTKQAFANMSFEDEIQHHHGISSSNTTNSVTITRC